MCSSPFPCFIAGPRPEGLRPVAHGIWTQRARTATIESTNHSLSGIESGLATHQAEHSLSAELTACSRVSPNIISAQVCFRLHRLRGVPVLLLLIEMWLIHIDTLKLHAFYDRDIPKYYILSHRWEDDETSFKDAQKSRNLGSRGWTKVQSFCRFVREHPPTTQPAVSVEYVWVDTCCIDKKSSAELSEAINSMWVWYQRSVACYVYLNNVPSADRDMVYRALRKSQWFTRGWTLQELLSISLTKTGLKSWETIVHSQ